ncbi:MAG: hypothetical protein KAV87_60020, partial [Desulfobacteraceae bacterium]|nr:hypothetical protein [Desulfobacteraceae bacterium]
NPCGKKCFDQKLWSGEKSLWYKKIIKIAVNRKKYKKILIFLKKELDDGGRCVILVIVGIVQIERQANAFSDR